MSSTTYIKTYNPPDFNKSEIRRFASIDTKTQKNTNHLNKTSEILPDTEELINNCIIECKNVFSYRVCYKYFPIKINDNYIDLGFTTTKSYDLIKNLKDCTEIILFAATVGIDIDRLILKYNKLSPAKALIFQAIGSERVETLCDLFCNEFNAVPRFSPGYGDLLLNIQKDVFTALECSKIGLTLNESLLMSPSKSVTAILGIKNKLKQ